MQCIADPVLARDVADEGAARVRLISVPDAGVQLGLCKASTWKLIKEGRLEAVKIGRRTLVPDPAIDAFIASLPRRA